MVLFDRVHDASRVITSMGNKVDFLHEEVQRLKEGGDPEAVATTEGQASEAQNIAKNLQAKLDETTRRRELIEKEFGETWEELVDLCQMDLSRQAIEDYKKSSRFEMGLVRIGRVSLEYGYQLASARLRA
ncbi:hypothetical protein B296_00047383 [Ensete ventricosum]|uniref:Uncharacterized protein n=1 Tax=Ensete ventricosum TaxID=4639 RepID=A0A426YRL3_ENSVE|nr:hypothetical protein B296_00047383 [Ensete ventricosum]